MPDSGSRSSSPDLTILTPPGGEVATVVSGPAETRSAAAERLPVLADCEIQAEIGRGGMGVVYRAWQRSLQREVAVKVLRDSVLAEPSLVARFRTEALAAAGLQHPGIVRVHGIGEEDGTVYFTMDFVEGKSLAQVLREDGPLLARRAAALAAEIADAIQHAHDMGVVHRDLKPSNVLLDTAGRARVLDFGLARCEGAEGLTLSGEVLGTPGYLSPEQAAGTKLAAQPATDVFGLGAVLYAMLTGRAPFTGESHFDVLQQVMHDDPVSVRLLNASTPRDLETVCLKALSKEPHRRYATARDMADDLRRFLDGRPVAARPVSALGKAWRWARRHRALAAALAAVFALTLGVAVVSTVSAQRLEKARASEETQRTLAEASAAEARLNLYTSDMKVAWQNWQEGYGEGAALLLEAHRPQSGAPDLRGFEWHYLHRQIEGAQDAAFPITASDDAAFSPDGAHLFTVDDGRAHLYDAARGAEILTWQEPEIRYISSYRRLERHPARPLLALSGVNGLRMVDLEKRTVEVWSEDGCESLAFSADGRWLAVASRWAYQTQSPPPHRVQLWDTAERKVVQEWPLEARGLEWSADGELVVLHLPGDSQARLSWYRPMQAEPRRTLPFSGGNSFCYAAWLHPATDRALLLMGDAELLFIRLSDGEVRQRTGGQRMQRAAFSPDGKQLALSGAQQAIQLVQTANWTLEPPRRGHRNNVLAVAFTADGSQIRSAASDLTLRHWNTATRRDEPVERVQYSDWHVWEPVMAPDGKSAALLTDPGLVSGADRTACVLWEFAAARPGLRLPDIPLAFSPDGRALLTLHQWSAFRIVDAATGGERKRFTLPEMPQRSAPRVSADGRWIAFCPERERTVVYELPAGRKVLEAATGSAIPSFSPDGRRIALSQDGRVVIYELPSGAARRTELPSNSLAVWSADGSLLAARQENVFSIGTAADNGTDARRFPGHRGSIGAMAFSRDGRTLVTAGEDELLRFWNVASGREALALPLPGRAHFLAFSPDGTRLLCGGTSGYTLYHAPGAVTTPRTMSDCAWMQDVPAAAAPPLPAPEPDHSRADLAATKEQLRRLWEACEAWRRQHGEYPPHLSALGDALPDKTLLSPAARRTGKLASVSAYADPAGPASFAYHWTVNERPPPHPAWHTGGPLTQRAFHERLRQEYGDATPFIRCWDSPQKDGHLAVLCDGTVCVIPPDWKDRYEQGWRPRAEN